MNKGIGRKSLIRYEQCLKEEEKTSQLAFSRKQKHLRLAFLPLLLSRTVYASLEVIWNVFAAEKFERIMCIQLYSMYIVCTPGCSYWGWQKSVWKHTAEGNTSVIKKSCWGCKITADWTLSYCKNQSREGLTQGEVESHLFKEEHCERSVETEQTFLLAPKCSLRRHILLLRFSWDRRWIQCS